LDRDYATYAAQWFSIVALTKWLVIDLLILEFDPELLDTSAPDAVARPYLTR
jgi:hypothetical protein